MAFMLLWVLGCGGTCGDHNPLTQTYCLSPAVPPDADTDDGDTDEP